MHDLLVRDEYDAPRPLERLRAELETSLLALIEAPLPHGMPAHVGFQRKEHALGALFATLTIAESRVLHARLSCPRDDDPLAAAFARFTADRRARLIGFLGDARRREALRRR